MTRWVKALAALVLAIAVPATAQTFGFSLGAAEPACLPIGNAAYRITNSAGSDVTVRIEAAAISDMRIAMADTPDEADFVFVDDGDAPACPRGAVKTVKIDDATAPPDLTVGLVTPDAPANYRIYVRSRWLGAETAAALFAAAQLPPRRLLARSN